MIDVAMEFLRGQLESWLAARVGPGTVGVSLTRVVDDKGSITLSAPGVGLSLLNVEEERTFRDQLPSQTYVGGRQVTREPELRLNLSVLVFAHGASYGETLKLLSSALTFFQANPAFAGDRHPSLDERIGRLTLELQTLGYEQLNQLWAFVGGKQVPSVVYRVRMVALQDEAVSQVGPPITTIDTRIAGR